jgi:hypothetical protein
MRSYDFCLAWNWEYDADFVNLLDLACQSRGLSLLQTTPGNLSETIRFLVNEEMTFRIFFDRASDADPRFIPVVQWACNHAVHYINPHELACRAWDKVAMHQAISTSMETPVAIVLPSYDEQPLLPAIDLASLGEGFTIKPALGGGGDGVVTGATSLGQVLVAPSVPLSEITCCRRRSFPPSLARAWHGSGSRIVQKGVPVLVG